MCLLRNCYIIIERSYTNFSKISTFCCSSTQNFDSKVLIGLDDIEMLLHGSSCTRNALLADCYAPLWPDVGLIQAPFVVVSIQTGGAVGLETQVSTVGC